MTRLCPALIGFIALATSLVAAAPAPARAVPEQPEETLPLPPIPPEDPPSDIAAPVPNSNLQAPAAALHEGPSLEPTLNERSPTLPGGDPVPGTVYRSDQEQRRQFIPNPGIRLVLPLEK